MRTKCDGWDCPWVWVEKISDIYVPAIPEMYGSDIHPDAQEDGYVDLQLWVCKKCSTIKGEVE